MLQKLARLLDVNENAKGIKVANFRVNRCLVVGHLSWKYKEWKKDIEVDINVLLCSRPPHPSQFLLT